MVAGEGGRQVARRCGFPCWFADAPREGNPRAVFFPENLECPSTRTHCELKIDRKKGIRFGSLAVAAIYFQALIGQTVPT